MKNGSMNSIDAIWAHPLFAQSLSAIAELEVDRPYCRHNLNHLLDVARIAMILNLEEEAGIPKETIYAAALLHDIGKHLQYTKRIPHEKSSSDLAAIILADCGFDPEQTTLICRAIRAHRKRSGESGLVDILYRADKLSRNCFACQAEPDCDWGSEKKNKGIRY